MEKTKAFRFSLSPLKKGQEMGQHVLKLILKEGKKSGLYLYPFTEQFS